RRGVGGSRGRRTRVAQSRFTGRLTGVAVPDYDAAEQPEPRGAGMEYRRFGQTDLRVSAIGFGCWEIGGTYGRVDEAQFRLAVERAIDSGITCFDTAEAYGMGVSERALGQALSGRRRDVVIATKFGVGYAERPTRRDSSRGRVIASIE